MPSQDRTSKQAAILRRDLWLAAKHMYTLPFLFGTPAWWLKERHTLLRPLSELQLNLYPAELLRIVVQFAFSLPIALVLTVAVLVGLLLHYISERTGVLLLALPLRITLAVLARVLHARVLRIPSPTDTAPTGSAGLRDVRSVLYTGRTYVARPRNDAPEEVWFYINGVIEQGAMVFATADLFQAMTGRMVNTFVNPSNGLPLDLLECILGRALDVSSAPVADIVPRVLRQLSRGRRVVLVGFSQGGIILSNVVKYLVAHADDDALARVEAYSFASAADEFARRSAGPFAEHFASELDFVSRFGALTFSGALDGRGAPTRTSWNGRMHMLPASTIGQGHLLKEMLLPAFKAGLFGRSSNFWNKYCDRESSAFRPILEHLVEEEG